MKRVRPFEDGLIALEWYNTNCFQCKKSIYPHRSETGLSGWKWCELQCELTIAGFTDGTCPVKICERICGRPARIGEEVICKEIEWKSGENANPRAAIRAVVKEVWSGGWK